MPNPTGHGKRIEVTNEDGTRGRARSARMPMQSTVLLSRGADAWTTDIEDISASGVLVRRPDAWRFNVGDLFALDMMIGPELNIHVEASVARMTAEHDEQRCRCGGVRDDRDPEGRGRLDRKQPLARVHDRCDRTVRFAHGLFASLTGATDRR
jgi:hypothetical protein